MPSLPTMSWANGGGVVQAVDDGVRDFAKLAMLAAMLSASRREMPWLTAEEA